jgi:hypothetical protein
MQNTWLERKQIPVRLSHLTYFASQMVLTMGYTFHFTHGFNSSGVLSRVAVSAAIGPG